MRRSVNEIGYAEDLAHVHDSAFSQLAQNASEQLRGELLLRKIATGRVLDLGCGGGVLSADLTAAGFDVWGCDLSPALIQRARRRCPRGVFELGSIHAVRLPPCVAVATIGEVVNYQFDARPASALVRLARRVARALRPAGVWLFDAAAPGRGSPVPVAHVHHQPEWTVNAVVTEDARRRLLTRHIVCFRRVGRDFRRHEETHVLRLFEPSEVLATLRNAGFVVHQLSRYANLTLPPGLVGYLATRKN